MTKSFILLFFFQIFTCALINGQLNGQHNSELKTLKSNDFFVELGGSNFFLSANYQRLITTGKNKEFRVKLGFTYLPGLGNYDRDWSSINFEPNLSLGKDQKRFVLGLGFTYIYLIGNLPKDIDTCCDNLKLLMPRVGYKRYNKSYSSFWSVSFTPWYLLDKNEEGDKSPDPLIFPFGGVSWGKVF